MFFFLINVQISWANVCIFCAPLALSSRKKEAVLYSEEKSIF